MLEEGGVPATILLRRVAIFNLPGQQRVLFRASTTVGRHPWFDFAWFLQHGEEEWAEVDPVDPTRKRALGKLWGFTQWAGVAYAFVTLYTKARTQYQPHPVLQSYKHVQVTVRDRSAPSGYRLVPPFWAVPVQHLLATAVAFPDPDREVDNSGVTDWVLVHEPFVTICGGQPGRVPDPYSVNLSVPERLPIPPPPKKRKAASKGKGKRRKKAKTARPKEDDRSAGSGAEEEEEEVEEGVVCEDDLVQYEEEANV